MNRMNLTELLQSTYQRFKYGALPHVDEFMSTVKKSSETSKPCFHPADGIFYFVEKQISYMAIARKEHNLALINFDEVETVLAIKRLGKYPSNYFPPREDSYDAIHAKDTIIVDLTALPIVTCPGSKRKIGKIQISEEKSREEGKLRERIYGGEKTITTLKQGGIEELNIFTLFPKDVMVQARNGPFMRVPWVNGAHFNGAGDYFKFQIGFPSIFDYLRTETRIHTRD